MLASLIEILMNSLIFRYKNIHKAFLLILLLFSVFSGFATPKQKRAIDHVVGVVTDSLSGERLGFVNVYVKKNKKGTVTDLNGVFKLDLPVGTVIEASSMGYAPIQFQVSGSKDTVRLMMSHSATALDEVVIKPKKQKYSKKNNPAVDLMRRLREDKNIYSPLNSPYYSYDRYDKMVLALNDYQGYIPAENGEVKGKMKMLAELVDTAVWTGKRILDFSMKEKVSTRIVADNGNIDKDIVIAQRNNGIDKGLDASYTRPFFEDALREVDIYDNDIAIMRNRFVSPLSAIAADFYKFYITDTTYIGADRCVELTFAPHNAETPGFNGKLYIPVEDSVKYVRRAMLRMPKAANINFIENLYLSQTFRKDSLGKVHKTLDDMIAEMHITGNAMRIYVARQSRFDNFEYDKRDDLKEYYSKIGNLFALDDSDQRDADFWNQARMIPLSRAEKLLAVDESPFRKMPVIYWTARAFELIMKGYVTTGKKSKFDFGPIDTFISYNATEGLRLAVGGITTANLSPHLFGRAYVAYGFRDNKWKYKGELEYSFLKKKYHSREFPMNGIRATYQYDVNNIGQHFMTNSANNLLNSIKRLQSNLTTYQLLGKLEYNIEWRNNLALHASVQHIRQESTPYVQFIDADGYNVSSYSQNSMRLQLRYAPGEKYMQTVNERKNLNRDALTVMIAHEFGPKGLWGSEYTLNLTELMVQKRFWFSAFGSADVVFKGAKLWNQVQFPALLWQNANTAYTVQTETFSLLNPMEFAMDQYVSLDLNYNMNGLILNRIPFVKKAKLREVITFKGFWGNLTRKNNPAYNDNLFKFPEGTGKQMGHTPYMELGVGITNILKVLRLDYIWRLSYRNTPHAPNSGLRFSFLLEF